jgi:predicted DNA-binding transcriptional regulator AlpA
VKKLLGVAELSLLVGATPGTLYQWRSQGRLDEYLVRVGRSVRFDLARVEAAIERGAFAQPTREERR